MVSSSVLLVFKYKPKVKSFAQATKVNITQQAPRFAPISFYKNFLYLIQLKMIFSNLSQAIVILIVYVLEPMVCLVPIIIILYKIYIIKLLYLKQCSVFFILSFVQSLIYSVSTLNLQEILSLLSKKYQTIYLSLENFKRIEWEFLNITTILYNNRSILMWQNSVYISRP